ncbi:alpha-glucan family phosphorylase [Candidatus Nitrospira salsa]
MRDQIDDSTISTYFSKRSLPKGLEGLNELALDLRWTWSHFSDQLWERLDPEAWERTANPYFILQSVRQARLEEATREENLKQELKGWLEQRQEYLKNPGWFGRTYTETEVKGIAYFSMEFGLSEALPIYSGGLGILAGDHLKAASDLGVPIVGIGLLYQQGYFRQILNADAWQLEAFPYNDPINLPVTPVPDPDGGWLRITLELPGRTLLVRVWQAQIGKVMLYLLDSNDPLNSPRDRGITANLYPAGPEQRLMQEIVLGVGGWRVLEELDLEIDVCHLNEGHAAFAILARVKSFMTQTGQSFPVALGATRAGNVFTTHTPVEAGFDRFEPNLIRPYAQFLSTMINVSKDQLFALGRRDPANNQEPFSMAYLAIRGSGYVNGVSCLHGHVSREIFQPLFPQWPTAEVPVRSITNGVHVPSWDSSEADALWTRICGKSRWLGTLEELCPLISNIPNRELWAFRVAQRQALINYVRRRLVRQHKEHGASADHIQRTKHVLDPNALTLGYARRFTAYKRPTLLLHDRSRLARLLSDSMRPVQLIIAGKAHPKDDEGKRLVQMLAQFASDPQFSNCVVFLEDYDMALAQELVAGVDVWLNTPRRPLEASGTSGMKVLVNGGLNLSVLDGWWDEAYAPEVGWAIGEGNTQHNLNRDTLEAEQFYQILEQQIIPEFYNRNQDGIPHAWTNRVRASMSRLTAHFSSNRMVREYVEQTYIPAAKRYRDRVANETQVGKELQKWQKNMQETWETLRFGELHVTQYDDHYAFDVQVYMGDMDSSWISVELYADDEHGEGVVRVTMKQTETIPGMVNAYRFKAEVPASRPVEHYTPRIVPCHPSVFIPLEISDILWYR